METFPKRLRTMVARAQAVVQFGPAPLGRPTRTEIERLGPLIALALDERSNDPEPLFNEPPIFPYDIQIGQDYDDATAPTKASAADTIRRLTTRTDKLPPPRRSGVPLDCPCTAIYSSCRCPGRR